MQILFSLGSNGSGQLGIGHKEDVSVPKPVLLPSSYSSEEKVSKIAAGGNHTLLLTSSGKVYWAGDAALTALSSSTTDDKTAETSSDTDTTTTNTTAESQFNPLLLPVVPSTAPVTHIAATWTTSLLASHSGTRLWTLGTGQKGELGLGPLIIRTPTLSQIPNFPPPSTKIIDLSASMAHAVAVLDDGSAWGWGAARKGQLGPSSREPESGEKESGSKNRSEEEAVVCSPRWIEGVDFPVARAVCGREFTCLFGDSKAGEFLTLGSDKWGIKKDAPSPDKIAGWKDVGAGWGNVFVLRGDGKVVSWGRNDHGQLSPENLPPAERIAVGSEHALALSEEGDVTAWGWGEHGNCGPISKKDGSESMGNIIASSKYVPAGAKITAIGGGCATSWIAIDMPTPS